jgi:formylmethanofuran dehydrogenase subunit B
MVVIIFGNHVDFLEDTIKDKGMVDRNIVRVTVRSDTSKVQPAVRHVSIVAQCVVDNSIYEYREYMGNLTHGGNSKDNDDVKSKVEQRKSELLSSLKNAGFDVRGGHLQIYSGNIK